MRVRYEEKWYIIPICLWCNSCKTALFTLSRDITAIEIEPDNVTKKVIPVLALAAHDPEYQTIYLGDDNEGKPMYDSIYMGSVPKNA
jgi:glutaredoxin